MVGVADDLKALMRDREHVLSESGAMMRGSERAVVESSAERYWRHCEKGVRGRERVEGDAGDAVSMSMRSWGVE